MNYRYTQKDIKIIDMSNEADFMYNWIRRQAVELRWMMSLQTKQMIAMLT